MTFCVIIGLGRRMSQLRGMTRIAKQYHAYEKVDKSDFQRKARILQSMWREEQNYPIRKRNKPTALMADMWQQRFSNLLYAA